MNTNTLQSVQSNDTDLDNTVYFIGQDLHSNNVYVTVMVNQVREDGTSYGKVVASRRITLRKRQKEYIDFMSRFCEGKQHIAVVESTYNVYWMNDLFEERGWNLLIADPSTVSRDKTKACNDKTDATFLADTLRSGSCHVTRLLPSEVRYPRDLVRTRQTLIAVGLLECCGTDAAFSLRRHVAIRVEHSRKSVRLADVDRKLPHRVLRRLSGLVKVIGRDVLSDLRRVLKRDLDRTARHHLIDVRALHKSRRHLFLRHDANKNRRLHLLDHGRIDAVHPISRHGLSIPVGLCPLR